VRCRYCGLSLNMFSDNDICERCSEVLKKDRERIIKLIDIYDAFRCKKGCNDCDKEYELLREDIRNGKEVSIVMTYDDLNNMGF